MALGETHAALVSAQLPVALTRADLLNLLREVGTRKCPQSLKGRALIFDLQPGEPICIWVEPWNTVVRLQALAPADIAAPHPSFGRRRLSLLAPARPADSGEARVWLIDDSPPATGKSPCPRRGCYSASPPGPRANSPAAPPRRCAAPRPRSRTPRCAAPPSLLADAGLLSLDELADELQVPLATAQAASRFAAKVLRSSSRPAAACAWRPIAHLPFAELTAAGEQSLREENAELLVLAGKLELLTHTASADGVRTLAGTCQGSAGRYALSATLAPDGSFASATCECAWMRKQNGTLQGGPCKHLLALRNLALREALNPWVRRKLPPRFGNGPGATRQERSMRIWRQATSRRPRPLCGTIPLSRALSSNLWMRPPCIP